MELMEASHVAATKIQKISTDEITLHFVNNDPPAERDLRQPQGRAACRWKAAVS
jgi:hypothetical protein